MVRYKDWTGNEGKSSQCPKKQLLETFRNPGELLLKTTFKNLEVHFSHLKQIIKKCGLSQDFCTVLYFHRYFLNRVDCFGRRLPLCIFLIRASLYYFLHD